ncbi:hypothetical protein ACFQ07_27330 [Actinomadura adrarensis]|uniref:Uncharacterized protein n=1 Tax=Actinomadura adrarensis TaxID=1819600 RepID=A0ABW3CQB2_9ACTN
MADSVKLRVTGPPEQVGQVLEQALQPEGFRFAWSNPQDAILEKGTFAKALLLGAFSPHFKYRLLLHPQQDGTVIVDIGLANTGLVGGAIGVARVRKGLDGVGEVLNHTFQQNGTFVGAV